MPRPARPRWRARVPLQLGPVVRTSDSSSPKTTGRTKLGEYRAVYGMRIDPTKVGHARIFRPWGWCVALIISEEIKEAIKAAGLSGTRFIEV